MLEIERLRTLIPDRLQPTISIDLAVMNKPKLIESLRCNRNRYAIYINFPQWRALDLDSRNLLFWHELARIQNGSIYSDRSTARTLIAALAIAFIDLSTHNILVSVVALTIAGLASFRLYQNHWGERNVRQLTAADRGAIEFAVEFGCDRDRACELLKSAIIQIRVQSPTDRSTKSTARLLVLSMTDR
jgi:hypothetical protein